MNKTRQPGKIDLDSFRKTVWNHVGRKRAEVIAGPQYGVDVSVVQLPDGNFLASSSDPASLVPGLTLAESAWLTVHLTANDMVTTGHMPMYAQFVLNLPEEMPETDFETYWFKIHEYSEQMGIAITGGHTGRVTGQKSSFVGGVTMSLVASEILLSRNATPGQAIVVTKGCAWSAAAILAKAFPETVKSLIGPVEWQKVSDSFFDLSVAPEAIAAYESGAVSAMHDVTEGGVLGALREMCLASGVGADIFTERLPAGENIRRIAGHFGFDPHATLGSGALVIACDPEEKSNLISKLASLKIPAFDIGHFKSGDPDVTLCEAGNKKIFVPEMRDGYWTAYAAAIVNGWR